MQQQSIRYPLGITAKIKEKLIQGIWINEMLAGAIMLLF
jgi:hypothetical protein